MSNISATGTVFNLPNFAGQLYSATPSVTPFLNLIREKAVKTDNFQFSTGVEYSHEAASQPAISENASLTAPTAVSYVRSQNTNVTQIFHEKVSVTYAKQSSGGRLSGVSSSLEGNCAPNELDFQTARAIEKIARDVEYTFINGVYQLAANSSQANKTRGMLAAAGTVIDCENAALTQTFLNAAFKTAFDAGADFTDMVLICNSSIKQYLSTIYASQAGFNLPDSRNTGGVNLTSIETDFGPVRILIDRFMPAGVLLGADISCIRPVEQDVPDKGNFFREPLSKTGAAEEYQIFGQIGLDHGPAWKHFKIVNIA
ncbi:MAG: DUF5309 family protein [Clostridia bacterium]|nr:DUF5309 family protein [Clostridia bacterium]